MEKILIIQKEDTELLCHICGKMFSSHGYAKKTFKRLWWNIKLPQMQVYLPREKMQSKDTSEKLKKEMNAGLWQQVTPTKINPELHDQGLHLKLKLVSQTHHILIVIHTNKLFQKNKENLTMESTWIRYST